MYESKLDAEGGGAKSSRNNNLWALLGAAEAGFVIFFTIFVGTMAAKYRVTFFSTVTAKKFNCDIFRNATSDEVRIGIFFLHLSYHAGIRDEVKAWVTANYSTWNEEQPQWFTDRVKASIPKDMIPEIEVEQNSTPVPEAVAVKETRRNSILKVVAEASFEEVVARRRGVTQTEPRVPTAD